MAAQNHSNGSRAGAAGLALLFCLAAACATMEAPRGGPEDRTPPTVVAFSPDSGSVALKGVDRFVVTFSEKVQPRPAETVLRLYPDLEIRKTKWKGRREMTVELFDTLPADTTIIVEIPRGVVDIHRVPSKQTWIFPLATADSFPPGTVAGQILLAGEPVKGAVAELYAVPPDSSTWERQPLLRRAEADTSGRFALPWLPAPGGPWLLRVFVDANGDLRAGENEAQRLWPEEYDLRSGSETLDVGILNLFDPKTPGRIEALGPSPSPWDGNVFGWPLAIADDDTGFVPVHARTAPTGFAASSPGDTVGWDEAGPGLVRLILFVDLDGDSLLSALPDTLAPDSVVWSWEPFAWADSIEVEPGRPVWTTLPAFPDTLSRSPNPPAPVSSRPDSTLMTTAADSLAAASPDSVPPPEPEE